MKGFQSTDQLNHIQTFSPKKIKTSKLSLVDQPVCLNLSYSHPSRVDGISERKQLPVHKAAFDQWAKAPTRLLDAQTCLSLRLVTVREIN